MCAQCVQRCPPWNAAAAGANWLPVMSQWCIVVDAAAKHNNIINNKQTLLLLLLLLLLQHQASSSLFVLCLYSSNFLHLLILLKHCQCNLLSLNYKIHITNNNTIKLYNNVIEMQSKRNNVQAKGNNVSKQQQHRQGKRTRSCNWCSNCCSFCCWLFCAAAEHDVSPPLIVLASSSSANNVQAGCCCYK